MILVLFPHYDFQWGTTFLLSAGTPLARVACASLALTEIHSSPVALLGVPSAVAVNPQRSDGERGVRRPRPIETPGEKSCILLSPSSG